MEDLLKRLSRFEKRFFPRYRDEYLKAIHDDPMLTKPLRCPSRKLPRGVTLYQGSIHLPEE